MTTAQDNLKPSATGDAKAATISQTATMTEGTAGSVAAWTTAIFRAAFGVSTAQIPICLWKLW